MTKQDLDDWYNDIANFAAEHGWDNWQVRWQLAALAVAEERFGTNPPPGATP